MAITTTAYKDSKGRLHTTAEQATIADIADLLGGSGAAGTARQLLDDRAKFEELLAQHDAMCSNTTVSGVVGTDPDHLT